MNPKTDGLKQSCYAVLHPADALDFGIWVIENMSDDESDGLLDGPARVINIGLKGFAEELERQGVDVTHMDWSPPAGGNARLADLLAKLNSTKSADIDEANAEAVRRILAADPVLVVIHAVEQPVPGGAQCIPVRCVAGQDGEEFRVE